MMFVLILGLNLQLMVNGKAFVINAKNKQLATSQEFAHGYLVCSPQASVYYKVDNRYNESERYS